MYCPSFSLGMFYLIFLGQVLAMSFGCLNLSTVLYLHCKSSFNVLNFSRETFRIMGVFFGFFLTMVNYNFLLLLPFFLTFHKQLDNDDNGSFE